MLFLILYKYLLTLLSFMGMRVVVISHETGEGSKKLQEKGRKQY